MAKFNWAFKKTFQCDNTSKIWPFTKPFNFALSQIWCFFLINCNISLSIHGGLLASLINTLLTQQKHVRDEIGALWTKVKDWNLFEAYCTAPAISRELRFLRSCWVSFEIVGSMILDSNTWKNTLSLSGPLAMTESRLRQF